MSSRSRRASTRSGCRTRFRPGLRPFASSIGGRSCIIRPCSTFELSRPLTAGKHVVRVENTGAQAHEVVIAALTPGKTLKDFIAWEEGGEKGPLPTGAWVGGVTTIEVGAHSQFTTTFAPGSYLL